MDKGVQPFLMRTSFFREMIVNQLTLIATFRLMAVFLMLSP